MADEILDEYWRVRAELVKKHGGMDGYWKYNERLDRARRARQKRKRAKSKKRPAKIGK